MRNKSINLIGLFTIILFLSACAAMYGSPESRMAANRAASDYALCERLAVATLAPTEVRGEWASELQRRRVDCNQFAPALNNVAMMQQQMFNYSS